MFRQQAQLRPPRPSAASIDRSRCLSLLPFIVLWALIIKLPILMNKQITNVNQLVEFGITNI